MTNPVKEEGRLSTGIPDLDALLCGGLPRQSVTVFGGTPGSGKTILSQQIAFHNATSDFRALFFQTLSEPTAKTLRYLRHFDFFDPSKLGDAVQFVDLGGIMRGSGLTQASGMLMEHVKRVKPAVVIVDSFKVFKDLADSREELRKFSYEVAINLMAWECTAFLLGEFAPQDIESNPLFSIVDGIITLAAKEVAGEQDRVIKVIKMRGTDHDRDEHALTISNKGISVFAPRVAIRDERSIDDPTVTRRHFTGIRDLDALLGEGILDGSSLVVSGAAGTGKTLLCLEALYRGAREQNAKGIMFSFEETQTQLLATGKAMGWDLEGEVERGMLKFVCIPQPNIRVPEAVMAMRDAIHRLGATRVVVDSTSLFLHKLTDPRAVREKLYQLATLVHNAGGVGLFVTDLRYGAEQLSCFGAEETAADGVILLTAPLVDGHRRGRFLEVYKLRNTTHERGRHPMRLEKGGIEIDLRPVETSQTVA